MAKVTIRKCNLLEKFEYVKKKGSYHDKLTVKTLDEFELYIGTKSGEYYTGRDIYNLFKNGIAIEVSEK
jgi:hypothetical protein